MSNNIEFEADQLGKQMKQSQYNSFGSVAVGGMIGWLIKKKIVNSVGAAKGILWLVVAVMFGLIIYTWM